jgi:hypothetical protein
MQITVPTRKNTSQHSEGPLQRFVIHFSTQRDRHANLQTDDCLARCAPVMAMANGTRAFLGCGYCTEAGRLINCSCISSVCQFRAPVSSCHLAVASASARWSTTTDCTQLNWNSQGLVWSQRIAILFAAALEFPWGDWGSLVSQRVGLKWCTTLYPVQIFQLAAVSSGVSWEESATWASDRRPNQNFGCSLSLVPGFIKMLWLGPVLNCGVAYYATCRLLIGAYYIHIYEHTQRITEIYVISK